MLGFYGIRLVDKKTGEVKRAENWKERFGNLERHFQAPLVRFFLEETLVKKTMSNVKRSVLDYFLFAVLDKHERQKLVRFAYLHYEPKEKFVWCPRKIQKQFRKAAKNSEVVGKDEVSLHGKSKDGEGAAMEQKEDGMNSMAKTPKGNDKNKEQSKQPEESPEPPVETESVGNGNVEICGESNIGNTSNGNESPDMDRSPSLDTETTKHEATTDNEQNSTSVSEDGSEKLDDMQMDKKTENPPKKKREDDEVPPNNHLAEDDTAGAVGHMEEKAVANKAAGQTSPSVHTPLKTSTHSPSLSSEREEKIPRTDFTQPLDKKEEEMSHENIPASNRMPSSKDVEEQRNGMESEVILME
ncbi:hypothetical protein XENOCAPTIV_027085 [Xenoophorus captivus]|uniref:Opioid growth factor receptor (OGFr) conserved domain-containing protein n=1 Tax=Xenoophorus captivus TaxID=1517983 RepID=A0ABV0R6E4_9TELE